MKNPLIFLAAIFSFGFSAIFLSLNVVKGSTQSENLWLPLTKEDLQNLVVAELDSEPRVFQSLDEAFSEEANKPSITPDKIAEMTRRVVSIRRNLEKGEDLWFLGGEDLPVGITIAGTEKQIHTLNIYWPIVNHTEETNNKVFEFLSVVYQKVFPEWEEASNWPKESLREAWGVVADYYEYKNKRELENYDPLIDLTRGGITSTTYGVPPDIIFFNITTQTECIPTLEKGNPFQKSICQD